MTEVAATPTDSEFEFLQGSMKDLAMKMGEIEDVLKEITGPEGGEETKQSHQGEEKENIDHMDGDGKEGQENTIDTSPSDENVLPKPADVTFDTDYDSDDDDSDDDDDGGLTDLQGELRQFEEMDQDQADAIVRAASGKVLVEKSVVVTATKPSPTSSVGVSMKTSKRITRIVGISESGLLANNTEIRVGQILIQVNDITIKNAKHARYIIQNASSTVKFILKQIGEEEAE